jgi:hypothetical protein
MADVDEFIKLQPGDNSMTLTITVGSGKIGSTTVSLDSEVLETSTSSPITLLIKRKADELNGKAMNCSTVVEDRSNAREGTTMTYDLAGCIPPFHKTITKSAEGGVAMYTALFNFFKV